LVTPVFQRAVRPAKALENAPALWLTPEQVGEAEAPHPADDGQRWVVPSGQLMTFCFEFLSHCEDKNK
jgi:hypothetical protein